MSANRRQLSLSQLFSLFDQIGVEVGLAVLGWLLKNWGRLINGVSANYSCLLWIQNTAAPSFSSNRSSLPYYAPLKVCRQAGTTHSFIFTQPTQGGPPHSVTTVTKGYYHSINHQCSGPWLNKTSNGIQCSNVGASHVPICPC